MFFSKKNDYSRRAFVDLPVCAKREFTEETGIKIPNNTIFIPLGEIRQSSIKIVHARAFE